MRALTRGDSARVFETLEAHRVKLGQKRGAPATLAEVVWRQHDNLEPELAALFAGDVDSLTQEFRLAVERISQLQLHDPAAARELGMMVARALMKRLIERNTGPEKHLEELEQIVRVTGYPNYFIPFFAFETSLTNGNPHSR